MEWDSSPRGSCSDKLRKRQHTAERESQSLRKSSRFHLREFAALIMGVGSCDLGVTNHSITFPPTSDLGVTIRYILIFHFVPLMSQGEA